MARVVVPKRMRIRFHKILAEGRSVRYEKESSDRDVLNLNVIVVKDSYRGSRPREF